LYAVRPEVKALLDQKIELVAALRANENRLRNYEINYHEYSSASMERAIASLKEKYQASLDYKEEVPADGSADD
jgi:hypothetical protein